MSRVKQIKEWTLSELYDVPWARGSWCGSFVSLDGTPATDFTEPDIARLVAYGSTDDDWDGESAGIVQLKDGRFVSWESTWGPTGSGFHGDAYGGDADIWFGATDEIVRRQISERGRELFAP